MWNKTSTEKFERWLKLAFKACDGVWSLDQAEMYAKKVISILWWSEILWSDIVLLPWMIQYILSPQFEEKLSTLAEANWITQADVLNELSDTSNEISWIISELQNENS